MTTIHRPRTLHETIARANVETLEARNRRLQRTIADLLDTQAAMVPLPTAEIIRALEHMEYHGCMSEDSVAWIRAAKAKL